MENYLGWLIGAAIIIALLLIGSRTLAARAVSAWTRWRLPDDERAVFDQKVKLLENTAIVEFVAPAIEFQREYAEGEKRRKPLAWLTPWPKAVQAGWKKHKSGNKLVDVRAQLRAAAQEIYVAVLPEDRQPSNASDGHFIVSIALGNRPEEQVRGLQSLIKGKLGLYSVDAGLSADFLEVEFVCHTEKPQDRLESKKIDARFFAENPAQSPALLPLAEAEDGCPWSLPLFHTLIYGLSGAGKGSVLNGIIRQLAPFVKQGRVVFYGIDPKFEDLDEYRLSSLFEKVTSEQAASDDLFRSFFNMMKQSQRERQLARAEGRAMPAVGTVENPYRVLFLDEGVTYLLGAEQNRSSKDIMPKFTEVMNAGRSAGFFVVLAAQNIDKDLLGRLRGGFANGVALRAENEWYNNTILGKDADKNGYDATLIRPANDANGYASAGIGYVKEETGTPIKVRFAFTSKADVEKLVAEFPPKAPIQAAPASVPAPVAIASSAPAAAPAPTRPAPTPLPRPVRAPSTDAPRSQVDELMAVKEWPTSKLQAARTKLLAKLQAGDNIKGRAFLDAVEAELRIRTRLEAMTARTNDDHDKDGPLPAVNF